jgi:16S rRNA processing protein RimM
MASSLTDNPEKLRQAGSVSLFSTEGPVDGGRLFAVEEVWEHQGRLVIKLGGVDTISDAERLKGAELRIPRDRRAPAEEGSYHLADLVGCRIEDRVTCRVIGQVEGWMETNGPLLIEVRSPEGEQILLPFAKSIFRDIDVGGRLIRAELPDGLVDINRR